MIPLNISLDHGEGVTVLSNRFIDQYMKDANDAQIKVYLYLLRMVSANLPTDIAEITEKFNYTEKDVLRALSYWEKMHLLSIDYDQRKNMTGIRLCNPLFTQDKSAETPAEEPLPVTFHVFPSKEEVSNVSSKLSFNSTNEAVTENVTAKQDVRMDYSKEKNSYSANDIAIFKENPDSKQLLFAAQQYLKRTISGTEIKTLLFIYDKLGFGLDLTDYLLQYCIGQGQKTFHAIEQTAVRWYEAGITDIKQAKIFLKEIFSKEELLSVDPKLSIAIMKLLGKQGIPAKKEQEYINRWIGECSYPMDLIEEACNRTVIAVDKNRFAYANSILESWRKNHIYSTNDLNEKDTLRKAASDSSRQTDFNRQSGTFCKIEQHDYDFDALEKVLLKG